MRFPQMAVFTERGLQPSVHFHGDIGLQSDTLGKVVVGMVCRRCPLFVEFAVKLVAAWRKRIEPRNPFEINIMIRLLRILKRVFGGTAPAVGFRAKVSDLSDSMA